MAMTLDEMNVAQGTPALIAHLEKHAWVCEKTEGVGYWTCKQPGTGVELILPSPNAQTGRVSLKSRIVALIGE